MAEDIIIMEQLALPMVLEDQELVGIMEQRVHLVVLEHLIQAMEEEEEGKLMVVQEGQEL